MGGKPVVEMAKQIDAEMDESGYVPPHRNCTPLGSQEPFYAHATDQIMTQRISAKGRLRS